MIRSLMIASTLFLSLALPAVPQDRAAGLKTRIMDLAGKAAAKGPDAKALRGQIEDLTRELIQIAPQQPVAQRTAQLHGNWKTVLPPDEKPDKPRNGMLVDQSRVYQVVSPHGYIYNILHVKDVKNPAKSRLGLLRGTYKVGGSDPSAVAIRYTRFIGCRACLNAPDPFQFAARAEAGTLPDSSSIVPDVMIGMVIKSGTILEVYSDSNLRIGYGTPNAKTGHRAIYVLRKA